VQVTCTEVLVFFQLRLSLASLQYLDLVDALGVLDVTSLHGQVVLHLLPILR